MMVHFAGKNAAAWPATDERAVLAGINTLFCQRGKQE